MEDPEFLQFADTRLGAFSSLHRVPIAGFRLEHPEDSSSDGTGLPWLVEQPSSDPRPLAKRYSPLDRRHRGMLETFVNLRTPEQARRFANRYGLLGSPRLLFEPERGTPRQGEPLWFWRKHIRAMLAIVTILDFIEARNRDVLSEVVVWQHDPLEVTFFPGAALEHAIAREKSPAPLVARAEGDIVFVPMMRFTEVAHPTVLRTPNGSLRWSRGDVFGPAWLYVCEALNKAVRGKVHSKLMPFAQDEHGRVPQFFVPDSLAANLYLLLQLKAARYEAPSSERADERRCGRPGCKNVFPAQGNRRFCPDEHCQKWARQQRNLRHNVAKRQAT